MIFAGCTVNMVMAQEDVQEYANPNPDIPPFLAQPEKKIRAIHISGNRNVPLEAIRAKIPYRVGQILKPRLSSELIRSLYSMGYFKPDITVEVADIDTEQVDVFVHVAEKEIIDEFVIEGNDNLKSDEIDKKVLYSDLKGFDQFDMQRVEQGIKDLYVTKDYHNVEIATEKIPVAAGKVKIVVKVKENKASLVRRVIFTGNNCIPSKKLRSLIVTREDWILGFLNKAGTYQPDAVEYDKYVLENYYHSCGFANARVIKVDVEDDEECHGKFKVTYHIHEGDLYTIGSVKAQENELMSEYEILARINIYPGELYSSEKLRMARETLRIIWGDYGYVFAEIAVMPIIDEEKKTVDLVFETDLGNKIACNRISISGNFKTRERVIRRELTVNEGDMLTTRDMDDSKERVQRLGYFEQTGGTNWKTTRLNDEEADLELVVKEAKTGRVWAGFKVGGDEKDVQNPSTSLQLTAGVSELNIMGTGLKGSVNGSFSTRDQQFAINIMNPWLFDRPIIGGIDIFHGASEYQEFKNVTPTPHETRTGGSFMLGFNTRRGGGLDFVFDLGFESIRFNKDIHPALGAQNAAFETEFQKIINNDFQSGNVPWVSAKVMQDHRNHPTNPWRGYLWSSIAKFCIPNTSKRRVVDTTIAPENGFGYFKWDTDAHWYLPLINDYDLIFHLHGHFGLIQQVNNYLVPYRELYHIGGPASVRGFLFGQIGPSFLGDSLGATRAFWMNAELIWPVTKDFNIVALAFYDGGAGWTPPTMYPALSQAAQAKIVNENFKFRQSIGVGFKMRSPYPVSIAIGLKLDRNKHLGESISEVHFNSDVSF